MPLTPAEIHSIEFRRPALGKRGYDEDEVDAFLDAVEQTFTHLTIENRSLREQLQRAGTAPKRERAALIAALARLKGEQARAEQQAREAQAALEQARQAAPAPAVPVSDGVIAMAQRTADDYVRDAQREAETLLAAARTKADQVTSEAQLKASTITSDARHRHTEAITGLTGEREAALAEIDRLARLAQEQRDAVHRQVTRRLRDLLDPGSRV
ncbi:DivIVA domain-containing protein [Actinoplanes sp. NPDC024001]|uniref:DivIVA domain-containing protein n=1 Tax=Actinoplanes sp. NPDC024001 TaxID=3154598 RepID=UPI0033EA32B5